MFEAALYNIWPSAPQAPLGERGRLTPYGSVRPMRMGRA